MADKEDSNNQPSDQSRPQPDDIGQGPDDIHSLMPGLVLDHSELVPYEDYGTKEERLARFDEDCPDITKKLNNYGDNGTLSTMHEELYEHYEPTTQKKRSRSAKRNEGFKPNMELLVPKKSTVFSEDITMSHTLQRVVTATGLERLMEEEIPSLGKISMQAISDMDYHRNHASEFPASSPSTSSLGPMQVDLHVLLVSGIETPSSTMVSSEQSVNNNNTSVSHPYGVVTHESMSSPDRSSLPQEPHTNHSGTSDNGEVTTGNTMAPRMPTNEHNTEPVVLQTLGGFIGGELLQGSSTSSNAASEDDGTQLGMKRPREPSASCRPFKIRRSDGPVQRTSSPSNPILSRVGPESGHGTTSTRKCKSPEFVHRKGIPTAEQMANPKYTARALKCPQCKSRFDGTRPDNLQRHIDTVHNGSNQWVCPIPECLKGCTRKDNLNQHLEKKHKNLCPRCGAQFDKPQELYEHFTESHPAA